MEVLYCLHCKSRVSSTDIDSGKGIRTEKGVFCHSCVKELGLGSVKPEKRKKTPSSRIKSVLSEQQEQVRRRTPAPSKGINPVFYILGIII